MGHIGISVCDMCGKRTQKFAGSLTLFDETHRYHKYTARSWKLCKTCYNKMCALQTGGDKIKEELELKLDEIRVKYNPSKLLS